MSYLITFLAGAAAGVYLWQYKGAAYNWITGRPKD